MQSGQYQQGLPQPQVLASRVLNFLSSAWYSGSSSSFLSAAVVCSSVIWSLSRGAKTTYLQGGLVNWL
jgi:hypothetical protein